VALQKNHFFFSEEKDRVFFTFEILLVVQRGRAALGVIFFPPLIGDKAANGQGREGQVKNARVQSLCRLFTQLLGSARADGTLRIGRGKCQKADQKNKKEKNTLMPGDLHPAKVGHPILKPAGPA
jgi:hypothetical protein